MNERLNKIYEPKRRERFSHGGVTVIEVICSVVIMILGEVAMFGVIHLGRAEQQAKDPFKVAASNLKAAADQLQRQKFQPCTSTNPEPYTLDSAVNTPVTNSKVLAIATKTLPLAQAPYAGKSHPYFAKLRITNGVTDFAWTLSPSLPPGLSLSSDGVISGAPQAESSGIYKFTVISNGNSDSKLLSLTIVSLSVQVNNSLLQSTPCERNSDSTIVGVSADGSTVTYSYSSPTTLVKGDTVSITGVNPASLNVASASVLNATATEFVIAKRASSRYISGGHVALASRGKVQQITLSTTVHGEQLTRFITLAS